MQVLRDIFEFFSNVRRIREALEESEGRLAEIREILRPFGKQPDDPRYKQPSWKVK